MARAWLRAAYSPAGCPTPVATVASNRSAFPMQAQPRSRGTLRASSASSSAVIRSGCEWEGCALDVD